MIHLQVKTANQSKTRTIGKRVLLTILGLVSPILPGFFNIAHAQVVDFTFKNLLNPVMELWFMFAAKLTTWSGWLLDLSVEYFVLNMAEQVSGIGAIDGLWQTFRDLGNIVFIGVLLYIAILTVLGMGNKYNTKRMLVRLVIVALFVNFSLFATKVVIDTSNVAALQFYNAVQVEDCGADTECNLSHFFVDALNISSVNSPAALEDSGVNQSRIFIVRMMGTWFLLTTAFVLGSMAFLLIIRFVVLILLMIASPLAFIAFALPGSKDWGMDWVNKLLEQSFFAPAMLAMVYITARLAGDIQSAIGSDKTDLVAALVSDDSDAFSVILVYIILIGLMVSALLVAKKLGAHGASKSIEWGKKARNWGQTTIVGSAGMAARSTVGALGQKADSKLKKTRFAQSFLGSQFRDATTKSVAEAKFGGKTSAAQVAKERKQAKGRIASYEARQTARQSVEEATNDAERRRALGKLSSKEKIDFGKKFLKDHAELLSESDFKAIDSHDGFSERDKQEIKEAANQILTDLKGKEKDDLSDKEEDKLKAFLGSRSDNQLKEIDIELLLEQPGVIANMSASQFDTVLKNKSKKEKDDLVKIRIKPFKKAIESGSGSVREYLGGMKKPDVAKQIERYIKDREEGASNIPDSVLHEIDEKVISELMSNLKSEEQEELRSQIKAKVAQHKSKKSGEGGLYDSKGNPINSGGSDNMDKLSRAAEHLEKGPGKSL